jgi:hypothetical protein
VNGKCWIRRGVPLEPSAVELAESWRTAGTASWFRGQNRLWPIATTLGRRQGSSEEIARVNNRLQRFCDWLGSVPELRHLLEEEHLHAVFAILQHYGVPTHYVDFTVNPKVAGFFAGVGPDAEPGQDGCIIAIDPDDWVGILRIVAEVKHWPADPLRRCLTVWRGWWLWNSEAGETILFSCASRARGDHKKSHSAKLLSEWTAGV